MKPNSVLTKSTLAAIALVALGQPTFAQSTEPANKPAVAINRTNPITFLAPGQPVRILTETVKTSKPTDLLLSVTAESSIITDVVTTGSETQSADGRIVVYITMNNDPNPIYPSGSPGAGHPTQADTADVVFANQVYSRTTNLGLDDGNDMIQTYLKTKHASAFNWAVLNAQSGVHTIHVWARYEEEETSTARAQGMVGNRSLIVQPVKCQVNETVVDGSAVPSPMPITLN